MFSTLEFKLLRGNSNKIGEYLKKGEAELGIAVEIDRDWDRPTAGRCSPKGSRSLSTAAIRSPTRGISRSRR